MSLSLFDRSHQPFQTVSTTGWGIYKTPIGPEVEKDEKEGYHSTISGTWVIRKKKKKGSLAKAEP
jgi:hypothetical protein